MIRARQIAVFVGAAVLFFTGCGSQSDTPDPQVQEVVIYTSVDQHYAEPVLKEFERRTGIVVKAIYDVEAAKTTGLVNRLIAEKENPQADVFWNSEFVQTVRLEEQGVLAPFAAADTVLPAGTFMGAGGRWVAFGGRVRVILAERSVTAARYGATDSVPLSIFLDEHFSADRVGMAMPLFGTSATQAAMLWARDGADRVTAFYRRVKVRGIRIVDGNSVVRDLVVNGQLTTVDDRSDR